MVGEGEKSECLDNEWGECLLGATARRNATTTLDEKRCESV